MSKKETKEEKVKTYEDYRNEKIVMTGDEFIEHLNDIMVGRWVLSKDSKCIRQIFLTERNWADLISQFIGEEVWESEFVSAWHCLWDDGGLMRKDLDSEIVFIARSVAEMIEYTLPTFEGVYVAMRDKQYFKVFFLEN